MTKQEAPSEASAAPTDEAQRLAGAVLARIATGGGAEKDVERDILPLLGARAATEANRLELGRLVAALAAGGLIERDGERLRATPKGELAAAEFLGMRRRLPAKWAEVRDVALPAKALGLEGAPATRLKLVARADGLKALIVIEHWQLSLKGTPSPSRVRSALAVKALERAFGNQIRSGLGDKSALSAKAGRLLAGQLSRTPRDHGTDARLVSALAAEAVEAPRADLRSLQIALLRRYFGRTRLTGEARAAAPPTGPDAARLEPLVAPATAPVHATPMGTEVGPVGVPPPHGRDMAPVRPDPQGFARAVQAAAAAVAEGWAGNRRAFISKAFELIGARHPEWALTEIEFKCMLVEAHRTGLVVLASADLKDKRALRELQASAVVYKNTVWHYVRTDD